MDKEVLEVRLHYIYCVYGGPDGPLEEVRDFFSFDTAEDVKVYNGTEISYCLNKDGEEYVKFFDDDSPFSPWNNAFKRDGSYLVCDETCYFGINYYDVLLPVDEVDDIKNQLERRREELCLM